MRARKIPLKKKLEIIAHAKSSPSLKFTARHFKVQPSQIRAWRKNIDRIKATIEIRPNAFTTHSGRAVGDGRRAKDKDLTARVKTDSS